MSPLVAFWIATKVVFPSKYFDKIEKLIELSINENNKIINLLFTFKKIFK